MRSKIVSGLALGVLAAGLASPARADIWWTLKDVAFNDGGTATGSVSVAPDPYYAVGIVQSTSGRDYTGYTYDYNQIDRPTFETVTFMYADSHEYYYTMTLTFAHPLTAALAENDIVSGFECNNIYPCTILDATRTVTGGYAAAPEAPTWAMMIAGMGLLGFAGTRRIRRSVPAL